MSEKSQSRLIEVAGSPMEMGRMQGEMTADAWVNLYETSKGARVSDELQHDVAEHCPRQMERLVGIAAGAAVSVDTVLFALFSEVIQSQVDYYVGGCTAVALRGKASASGEPVIAWNHDTRRAFDKTLIARVSRPAGAFSSIDVTSGPLPGCYNGINEKGLAIAYNSTFALDSPSKLVPIPLLVQEALERFQTTEEALNYLTATARAAGGILMIADPGGDAASLELSPDRAGVRRPDDDRIAHTNHYHVPDMAAIALPSEACYSDKMPEPLRGIRVRESSETRYRRAVWLLNESDSLDENALMKILSDHGDNGVCGDNTICRHGSYFLTTCSTLSYPLQRCLKIAWGAPCTAKYETIAM